MRSPMTGRVASMTGRDVSESIGSPGVDYLPLGGKYYALVLHGVELRCKSLRDRRQGKAGQRRGRGEFADGGAVQFGVERVASPPEGGSQAAAGDQRAGGAVLPGAFDHVGLVIRARRIDPGRASRP